METITCILLIICIMYTIKDTINIILEISEQRMLERAINEGKISVIKRKGEDDKK